MEKIIKSIMLIMIISTISVYSQDIKPYTELNKERDNYAITFRSTCIGMEIWLTNNRPGSNIRSRRIVMSSVNPLITENMVEMPFPINQKQDRGTDDIYLDGTPCFNVCNPNYGIFTSNRLVNGKTFGNDLYEMFKDGETWAVKRIDEVNSDSWDDTPSLSPDGKYLYFASDRKRPGFGETDLYMSVKLINGWSSPILLDDICEFNVREQTPLATADGYLYYSTDKSGDYDIWRVKINQMTGKPIAKTQELIPFEGVNAKGSSEGHPSFSPGFNWFNFSSDRNNKDKSYDLFYSQIGNGADTLYLKSLLRTMKFNKDYEEYEDAIEPYKTKIMAKDLYTNQSYEQMTDENGNAIIIIPRAIGLHPAQDRRIREIQINAITESELHISSTDTLVFEIGYNSRLEHSLYVWDVKVLEVSECKQNFPITDVEFFITGYWCPTTKRFSNYTSCQSVFNNPVCMEVPKIEQPCADNDLYNYTVIQPRVEKYRNIGLCADLREVEKHGADWSQKVDEAIVKFVDNVRSALKKPCIVRSIKQKKKITIEVIGWTDPRAIDNACLYTGKDIDFNTSSIKLANFEDRPYLKNGVLKKNTHFKESKNGGNQLLSEIRAYYTAELLDNLWKKSLPEYADLRNSGMLDVVAVGKSIKPDQIDMARQRSVNVRIIGDADAETIKSKIKPELGSSIALCGNECLTNLLCRTLEKTAKTNIEEVLLEQNNSLNHKLNDNLIIEDNDINVASPGNSSGYSVMFCSVNDEQEAKEIMLKIQNKFSDKLQISVFSVSKGVNLYRILSNCFKTLNDANKVLKTAMEISKEIGLERPPIIIAQ